MRARSRFTASRSVRSTLRRLPLLAHVDEVVDHHAAQVAEPQLPGDFLGGDLVELEGRFLGRAVGAEAAAVDVDRHEGLGLVDHERAAALERHLAAD